MYRILCIVFGICGIDVLVLLFLRFFFGWFVKSWAEEKWKFQVKRDKCCCSVFTPILSHTKKKSCSLFVCLSLNSIFFSGYVDTTTPPSWGIKSIQWIMEGVIWCKFNGFRFSFFFFYLLLGLFGLVSIFVWIVILVIGPNSDTR